MTPAIIQITPLSVLVQQLAKCLDELLAHEEAERAKGYQAVPHYLKGAREHLALTINKVMLAKMQRDHDLAASRGLSSALAVL